MVEQVKMLPSGVMELSTQWGSRTVEVRNGFLDELLNDLEHETISSNTCVSAPACLDRQEEKHKSRVQEKEAKTHRLAEEARLRQENEQTHSLPLAPVSERPEPLWPAPAPTPAPAPAPKPMPARARARKRVPAPGPALVPELRIHVKKLLQTAKPEMLEDHLEKHGCSVAGIDWVKDGERVRFAYVNLSNSVSLEKALELGEINENHPTLGRLCIARANPK